MTVTTDLGVNVITPSLYMDDKRAIEYIVNDMLLWYTKDAGGGVYTLYMLRQRDRFLTEISMATGLEFPYLHNVGMDSGLRVQLILKASLPPLQYA